MDVPKVALVTGSGKRRIGSYVAEALAERGYALAVHFRSSRTEAGEFVERLRRQGVMAAAFSADLTDELAVQGLVEGILGEFGRIDVLVNCAAIWERKSLEDVTSADVRKHFEANTLGTFLCCQRIGLVMCGQPEGGAIVNVGDWATVRPYLHYAAYFPSKGAIPTLTRTFAVELATRNPRVRVNCVLPGPVMLPPDLSSHDKEQAVRGTLLKREGSPVNVAQAVLALIENDFITGACLPVDGGRSIYTADGVE